MKRTLVSIAAAGLIGIGFAANQLASHLAGQPAVAAAATSARSAVNSFTSMTNVTVTQIDQATEHAYAVASPSVVFVDNTGNGTGSGVIYDTKGDIVTNNHVVSGASSLTVTLKDGRQFKATVVGTDSADDLAVIHINASGLTPAHFASSGGYQVAQTVLAIGNPLDLKGSVTSGLISGVNRVEQEPSGAYLPNAIQTSAPINPGNSGGALVTLDGTVVGIPTLEQTGTTNGQNAQAIGFAVPSSRVVDIANQIIQTGKVQHTGRAYLGLAPADAGSQQQQFSPFGGFGQGGGTQTQTGALVQQLASNGPAARAGVQQGDVITAINGTQVTSASDLLTALASMKPGDTVTLKIDRNGSSVTVTVHLGELPA